MFIINVQKVAHLQVSNSQKLINVLGFLNFYKNIDFYFYKTTLIIQQNNNPVMRPDFSVRQKKIPSGFCKLDIY